MKYKRFIARILVMGLIISLVSASSFMPVHAWKVGTHVYSANIIIDELRANNGSLEIEPFGKFRVDQGFVDAILAYPEYYRAGAMGPDVFPDIYLGQIVLHPGTSNSSAGALIETVLRRAMELPVSTSPNMDPASFYANANSKGVLSINYKQQAIAFALGLTTHEAGDLFGHSYVNKWAGGPWPDWVKEGVNETSINKVLRHNVVEAYIDKRIPINYQSAAYNSIRIPVQFVQDTLVGNGRLASPYSSSKDWNGLSVLYSSADQHPVHFKVFYEIRNTVARNAAESESYVNRHKNDTGLAAIDPVLLYNRAKEAYMEAWLEDIDAGLKAWVETGERAARLLLQHGGFDLIVEEYDKWADDHLLKMLGAPDVAAETISALGGVQKIIEETLPDSIQEEIKSLKIEFADQLMRWAYSADITNDKLSYEKLKAIGEKPEVYIKDPKLFKSGDEAQIQKELGNFANNSKAVDQTFAPFYNTLVMAKLNILTFDEGIRNLRYAAGSSSTIGNGNDISLLRDLKSLDVGYTWGKPEELAWFILSQSQEDKTKIFDKVFQISDSASVGEATIYNFHFGSWAAQMGSGSGVGVDYTLKAPRNGATIGMYKLSEMYDPQKAIVSQAIPSGTLKGSYYATVPFDVPGKYILCIYEGTNLLKASEAFEANRAGELVSVNGASLPFENEIVLSNMSFRHWTSLLDSGSKMSIDYNVKTNVSSNRTIGLYKLNDYADPAKAVKSETLIGSQGSFDVRIPLDKPGKYAVYVLSGQSVIARSSVFEVVQSGNVIAPDLTVLENISSGQNQQGSIVPSGPTGTIPGIDSKPVITIPAMDTTVQQGISSWTDIWETDLGTMLLFQAENIVTGYYGEKEQKIKGIVSGGTLKGTFTEADGSSGEMEFIMNSGNGSYTGKYRCNNEIEWRSWNGSRKK